MRLRQPVGRTHVAALIACSLLLIATPPPAFAEYGIPAGSGAVVTAGGPLLVRVAPGWDAAVSYEIADGSSVMVWDVAQAAPDGSMWYPVDGGFVPVDSVTSVATLDGGFQLNEDARTEEEETAPATTVGWIDPNTGEWVDATSMSGVTGDDPAVIELEQRGRDKGRDDKDKDEDKPGRDGADTATGNHIVDFAMQYVGYPYVYAGEGPDAFDCSGFTKFVYQNTLGIDITHDLFQQVEMGRSVDKNDLRPGDMVFFKNTFQRGLSHVGIYIGDGQFVNAQNESTGVVVSDINSDYYSSRWYGAVRLT